MKHLRDNWALILMILLNVLAFITIGVLEQDFEKDQAAHPGHARDGKPPSRGHHHH